MMFARGALGINLYICKEKLLEAIKNEKIL